MKKFRINILCFGFGIPSIFCVTSVNSQIIEPNLILNNKIKSVIQKTWNEGLLVSTHDYCYNEKGQLDSKHIEYFNYQDGSNNYNKTKFVYYNNQLVKTYHYYNYKLTDSTSHHIKWIGTDWIFTDSTYIPSTGKITVIQFAKTQDSSNTKTVRRIFNGDSLENEEITKTYKINDTIRITLHKLDLFHHGKKRTYENDSTVEISTAKQRYAITWENDKIVRKDHYQLKDSIVQFQITEEYDIDGKIKNKRETWYNQEGNTIKLKTSGRKNKTEYYRHETHNWKGFRTEERITMKRKNGKVTESSRSQFDSRNLPQHVIYYDNKENITGKITWEYTYW